MPALFFPNPDLLRLALVRGVIPPPVADAPLRAGFDSQGRLWLEPSQVPTRESLVALARLGVQALGDSGVALAPYGCWSELLPLRRVGQAAIAPIRILLELPVPELARMVARLRRQACSPLGIRL